GNLFVFKKGKMRREKPFMVCAHMDEVGIIIKEITADGYLKFDFVGGVDRRVVIGKRVFIGDKQISGVIGMRAVHLTTREERKKAPKTSELCIDIGCEKKSKAERLVRPGDFGVFDSDVKMLGEHKMKARAIDDRFGCAVMMKLISEELLYDTWFVFTVQEEVGCRGATVAAYSLSPAFSLVLESTTAADIPSSEGAMRVCAPGLGAVIGCMDGGTIYDKKLFSLLRSVAEEKNIKWQMKSRVAGGTDASRIHVSRGGVRTTSLSLATRYIHSPSSVADIRDMDAVLVLARELVNCKEELLNA
ncbi:MAG: M42 family peptidase, partial [Oscillospiraceae bacterium]|nr:M42 family peptidase [Oscillospiraceae bacterium]